MWARVGSILNPDTPNSKQPRHRSCLIPHILQKTRPPKPSAIITINRPTILNPTPCLYTRHPCHLCLALQASYRLLAIPYGRKILENDCPNSPHCTYYSIIYAQNTIRMIETLDYPLSPLKCATTAPVMQTKEASDLQSLPKSRSDEARHKVCKRVELLQVVGPLNSLEDGKGLLQCSKVRLGQLARPSLQLDPKPSPCHFPFDKSRSQKFLRSLQHI